MSNWTHAICEICYDIYWEPNGWAEQPTRVKWEALEPEHFPAGIDEHGRTYEADNIYAWCCFCRDGIDDGWGTEGVIYVRYQPDKLNCADLHVNP